MGHADISPALAREGDRKQTGLVQEAGPEMRPADITLQGRIWFAGV